MFNRRCYIIGCCWPWKHPVWPNVRYATVTYERARENVSVCVCTFIDSSDLFCSAVTSTWLDNGKTEQGFFAAPLEERHSNVKYEFIYFHAGFETFEMCDDQSTQRPSSVGGHNPALMWSLAALCVSSSILLAAPVQQQCIHHTAGTSRVCLPALQERYKNTSNIKRSAFLENAYRPPPFMSELCGL